MKKIISSVSIFFIIFFIPKIVLAMSCFPEPSSSYLSYLNKARIIVFLIAFVLFFVFNFSIIPIIFKRFQNKVKKGKLYYFCILVTILSFIFYGLLYFLIGLPNINTGPVSLSGQYETSLFPSGDSLTSLIYFIFNPINLISLLVSYISMNFLLKKYTNVTNERKKMAFFISVMMYPALGIFTTLFLSRIYYQIFPFVGVAWFPCR